MQIEQGSDAAAIAGERDTWPARAARRTHARFALLALLLLVASPPAARAGDKKPPPPPLNKAPAADSCAVAQASARYQGYGYTHVVTLRNGCAKAVECALWTDVDPEPRTTVTVAPGERAEIITRRGSPASEFAALKSCTYR